MGSDKILAIDGVWYSKDELILKAIQCKDNQLPQYKASFWQFICDWFDNHEFIVLKTSGSSGTPKQIKVSKEKIRSSAKRTIEFFNLQPFSSALICLSCDYIAGKMMVIRALEARMNIVLVEPSSMPITSDMADFDFVAMVPLQILSYKLMPTLLDKCRTLIIGGSAVTNDVVAILSGCKCCAYETYGMTETVSHIALRRVNGLESTHNFSVLNGVRVYKDERGCLVIEDKFTLDNLLVTNDRVELLSDGEFQLLGRYDNVINSGGIKISPEVVERSIGLHLDCEYAISWVEDSLLGQKMVLVTTASITDECLAEINLANGKYMKISKVLVVSALPKTENNKLDRLRLRGMIGFMS